MFHIIYSCECTYTLPSLMTSVRTVMGEMIQLLFSTHLITLSLNQYCFYRTIKVIFVWILLHVFIILCLTCSISHFSGTHMGLLYGHIMLHHDPLLCRLSINIQFTPDCKTVPRHHWNQTAFSHFFLNTHFLAQHFSPAVPRGFFSLPKTLVTTTGLSCQHFIIKGLE